MKRLTLIPCRRGYSRRRQWRAGAVLQDRYLLMVRLRDWKTDRMISVLSRIYESPYSVPPFPHVTLYGMFTLRSGKSEASIRTAIESSSRDLDAIRFPLSGWTTLRGRRGRVIAHCVNPSDELISCYRTLYETLTPSIATRSWIDATYGTRKFHITTGYGLRSTISEEILSRLCSGTMGEVLPGAGHPPSPGPRECQGGDLQTTEEPDPWGDPRPAGPPGCGRKDLFMPEETDLYGLRIALIRNGKITSEFDLPSQQWLDRPDVYRKERWAETLTAFRHRHGFELSSPLSPESPEIYLISDLHLGHANIIRYCRRPFTDAREMDRVLVSNWNYTVGPSDKVFFLGDLRYGPEARPAAEYLAMLQGNITLVRGNHDLDLHDSLDELIVECRGISFRLVHDPAGVSREGGEGPVHDPSGTNRNRDKYVIHDPSEINRNGDKRPIHDPAGTTRNGGEWLIHGHAHNNDLARYPFINYDQRTVNISAEVIGYRPVSIGTIVRCIKSGGPEPLRLLERRPGSAVRARPAG
ncbi:MAG: 2'-5' RNA ligase family protein [Methanoregulaceae archaeon]|nr:2'-5' RNA ligase family protein [Methanoregulaceae archaeon]